MNQFDAICQYMEKNKIGIIYLHNQAVIRNLFGDLTNVYDVIISRNNVYYRNKTIDMLYIDKNDAQHTRWNINDIIQRMDVSVIGIIFETFSIDNITLFSRLGSFYYFDVSSFFSRFLFIRNDEEVFKLHCSASITEKIIKKIFSKPISFVSDNNCIKNMFLEECGKVGAEKTHFMISQITSSKAPTPIYSIDCGVAFDGFYSDITRLFCYNEPDRQVNEAYCFLLELQDTTAKIIREGIYIKDLFLTLNRKYRSNSMFKKIQNGFGHGIGRNIHEGYSLRSDQRWVFENGLSFTLEPILSLDYIELRIENMYALMDGQVKRINTLLSDDIILVDNNSRVSDDNKLNDIYRINPEIAIFEGTENSLVANLSCDALARGKNLYYKVNQLGLEIIYEFKTPNLINNVKIKHQNNHGYIDYLISEEILI